MVLSTFSQVVKEYININIHIYLFIKGSQKSQENMGIFIRVTCNNIPNFDPYHWG